MATRATLSTVHHGLGTRAGCLRSWCSPSFSITYTSNTRQFCGKNFQNASQRIRTHKDFLGRINSTVPRQSLMSQCLLSGRDAFAARRAISRFQSSSSAPSNSGTSTSLLSRILNPNNRFMTHPIVSDLSIAVVAGHAAFLVMGMAYVTKDVLNLRLLAMTSISLTSIFQYYRPTPLRIPLRWNALFLAVNTFMAILLWEERHASNRMSPELRQLYREGKFAQRGISKLEFHKLFRVATRVQYKQQEQEENVVVLKRANEPIGKLYYIANGEGRLERSGKLIARLEPHDFVGEMEFVAYMSADFEGTEEAAFPKARVDVLIELPQDKDEEPTTIWVWDFLQLSEYLAAHRDVNNALLAYISHELCEKLSDSWDVSTAQFQKPIDDDNDDETKTAAKSLE